jgi:ATP-dependent protease HslVU (ClpYQ) peptidase subunit
MSVVIAYKEKGVVYMACDSQITRGGTRLSLTNPHNFKIWKVKGVENCLMGGVGLARDAIAIRLLDELIPEINVIHGTVDFELVAGQIAPAIIAELRRKGYYSSDDPFDTISSTFLLAYRDKLWLIVCDGSVIEIDDMCAIGSGESEAIGSLLSTEGKSPRRRLITAIKSAAAHDIYIDYPIVIADTAKTEFETILEDEDRETK